MWEHYCEVEQDVVNTKCGEPCNWCDKQEIVEKTEMAESN